jgi:DNA-binding MurR/RpiR family transcriptional regulator
MASWKRNQIGKIVKKSDDKLRFAGVKEFSLKIEQDITLKAGTYLNLENKAFKLASLEANREKMSPENYEKAVERINKMPDYVFFEVIKLDKES